MWWIHFVTSRRFVVLRSLMFFFLFFSSYILHTWCSGGCSTNTVVIHYLTYSVSESPFSSKSSKHHSQTLKARELKFWKNGLPFHFCHVSCATFHRSGVIFHMSCVTCQVSHVRCHMSQANIKKKIKFIIIIFLYTVVKLVIGGSAIKGAYPVTQPYDPCK